MAPRINLPDTPEAMLDLLSSLSDDELQEMFDANEQLERRLAELGPQNDDELHDWCFRELGINIPRTAVCEGHTAPFEMLADLYFERVNAVLGVGNRGGAKTFIAAVLHWLNSLFKPGCESCTFGATEAQSLRAYAHLKGWIYDKEGNKRSEISSSLMRETIFKNGSRVEVLPGTPAAVNGPHPQKAHADEIELMDDGTWSESRNMTVSGVTTDGRLIRPQDIATSTRKGPNGRVQRLIDEITKAVREGYDPPRKLYIWCIKETAAQVGNCQIANPNLSEELHCPCHRIRKGEWDDGSPRVLRDVCKGDFHRSRGWQPYGDIVKQFSENDRETFEVQQLCSKPEMKHHYVPQWADERHCIRGFLPDPENGPIFTSTDWGGTNPHAVNWYQVLLFPVEVLAWNQPKSGELVKIVLPAHTIVAFDEIYKAEIGNEKLGELVIAKEDEWKKRFPNWRVVERFSDPAGKAGRIAWKEMGLRTQWHATREFEEHIKDIRDLFEDDLFRVDGERCPMFMREIKAWRKDPKSGEEIEGFNHTMAEFRYFVANFKRRKKRYLTTVAGANLPTSSTIPRQTVTVTRSAPSPVGFRSNKDEFSAWRRSLGAPVTTRRQK